MEPLTILAAYRAALRDLDERIGGSEAWLAGCELGDLPSAVVEERQHLANLREQRAAVSKRLQDLAVAA